MVRPLVQPRSVPRPCHEVLQSSLPTELLFASRSGCRGVPFQAGASPSRPKPANLLPGRAVQPWLRGPRRGRIEVVLLLASWWVERKMHETFEHTADLGLRIRAADPETLFAEAGAALMAT